MNSGFFFLRDIVIVLAIGFIGGFIAKRFRLPLLVGYLLGGFLFVILTSSRFQFDASLTTLSDIGVALLLFTLGVEFSFRHIQKVRNIALWGGTLQILLTILAGCIILPNFGFSLKESIFLGSVFSLSSTALLVKILSDNGEIDTLPGEILVGMLLLQDLWVIPFMILLPNILSINTFSWQIFMNIFLAMVKAGGIIIAAFFFGKAFMPFFLKQVIRLNSREILLLGVVFLALSFTLFANILGLPSSIGAFLAGLLVSETVASHAVFSEVRPLRDIFSIVFFVLLGMLLSPSFFFSNIVAILLLTIFVVLVKSIITFAIMLAFSYHTKVSFSVASSLSSVGEFAFVMASQFGAKNLISHDLYNLILSTSLLTILITPWQMRFAPKLYIQMKRFIRKNPKLYNRLFGKLDYDDSFSEELTLEDHVVLLGHGRVGRVISRVLLRANIPFVGVDFNINVVEELKKKGVPFVYGDPSDIEVMDFAQVDKARAVVIAVSDRKSQEIMIKNALKLNPKVKIICRSHFEEDKEFLLATGAHMVVQPEKEAGLTIAQKILTLFETT